jgi:hypothetical protein
LRDLIAHADAPALIQAYEALRVEKPQLGVPELSAPVATAPDTTPESTQIWTEVSTLLGALDQRAARTQRALALLIEDGAASGGHLFLCDGERLALAASTATDAPDARCQPLAERHFQAGPSQTGSETTATTSAPPGRSNRPRPPSEELVPIVLGVEAGGEWVAIGVALLIAPAPRKPRITLARAVSRCLQLYGDAMPRSSSRTSEA